MHQLCLAVDRLYDGYIFDLDGTVYLGSALLPGALRVITALRELRRRVLFLTNNPTADVQTYVAKLAGLGLPAAVEEVVTTVFTTTQWLLQHAPTAVVYPISEEPLQNALRQAGIRISDDPREIDIVVVSYDRTLTWRKLQIAFEAIWYYKRARLICTNPDHFCPFPEGRGEVDAGPIIAAIEDATGARLEVNCGKPSPVMLETIARAVQIPLERCLMVGDRLYTEIKMGIEAGMDTALVLTGETSPAMVHATDAAQLPTYVLDRVDRVLPATEWDQRGWGRSTNTAAGSRSKRKGN